VSTSGPEPKKVRAAGGLVWRTAPSGTTEVVLVHRPRYDDWSLPKGKAHRSESDEDTALREVQEETGLRCVLGVELATIRYDTPLGESKTVRWWEMTVTEDTGFDPNEEVDQLIWVPLEQVAERSSLSTDGDVVHSFVAFRRR